MHDDPRIFPPLPTKVADPNMWEFMQTAYADGEGSEWLTCWEFMLTHDLSDSEGAAFWHGASIAMAAAKKTAATGGDGRG